jgi:hypothetical protein
MTQAIHAFYPEYIGPDVEAQVSIMQPDTALVAWTDVTDDDAPSWAGSISAPPVASWRATRASCWARSTTSPRRWAGR